jgi:ribose transport system permease protein
VRTLVQAAALAIGVAIYTVNWAALRRRFEKTGPPISIDTTNTPAQTPA